MPEWGMLPIPKPLLQQGVRRHGLPGSPHARISGTAYGTCVLHVAPESAVCGPLALVQDGDQLGFERSGAPLRPGRRARRSWPAAEIAWTPPPQPASRVNPREAGGGGGVQASRRRASSDFLDLQIQPAPGNVQNDLVAALDQRQRPADERLRRDVQHARAVGGAAHAGVGDPDHVADALLAAASWGSGACPTPACPGAPNGPALRSTSTESARRRPAPGRRFARSCRRSPRTRPLGRVCRSSSRDGGRVLDHAAVGRQRAAQDRQAALGCSGFVAAAG